jgi:hypothetical protein
MKMDIIYTLEMMHKYNNNNTTTTTTTTKMNEISRH